VGKEKWGVYGGGNHFAQWAGVHHRAGQLPNGLGDYLNIVLAGRGDNGNIIRDETFDAANAPGNHLIAFDFGFDLQRATAVSGATRRACLKKDRPQTQW
jgi:hypothetical protein